MHFKMKIPQWPWLLYKYECHQGFFYWHTPKTSIFQRTILPENIWTEKILPKNMAEEVYIYKCINLNNDFKRA